VAKRFNVSVLKGCSPRTFIINSSFIFPLVGGYSGVVGEEISHFIHTWIKNYDHLFFNA
jgi:hypothetical protein